MAAASLAGNVANARNMLDDGRELTNFVGKALITVATVAVSLAAYESRVESLPLPHFRCKSNEIRSFLESQLAFYKAARACNSPVCDSQRVRNHRKALPLPQQSDNIQFSGCQPIQRIDKVPT